MTLNFYQMLKSILSTKEFYEMIDLIESEKKDITYEKTQQYCEIIYLIGVSKAYRENCLSKDIIFKLNGIENINIIAEKYYKYVKSVIKFCASNSEKYLGEKLYTELDKNVARYIIK